MAEMHRQAPVNFWSRRRAAVEAEARADEEARLAAEALAQDQALAAARADKSDAEILGDLGLQDPDLMKMGDDFSAFMRKAVPEHLRRRALRRLWLSNPVLANLDGLLDYNDDFSDAATVFPDMKTSYQVGKGLLAHVEALAKAAEDKKHAAGEIAEKRPDQPGAEPEDADLLAGGVLMAGQDQETGGVEQAMIEAGETMADDAASAQAPPRLRHLRFDFAS